MIIWNENLVLLESSEGTGLFLRGEGFGVGMEIALKAYVGPKPSITETYQDRQLETVQPSDHCYITRIISC